MGQFHLIVEVSYDIYVELFIKSVDFVLGSIVRKHFFHVFRSLRFTLISIDWCKYFVRCKYKHLISSYLRKLRTICFRLSICPKYLSEVNILKYLGLD